MSKNAPELVKQLQATVKALIVELEANPDERLNVLKEALPDIHRITTEARGNHVEEKIAGLSPGSEAWGRWIAGDSRFFRKKLPIY